MPRSRRRPRAACASRASATAHLAARAWFLERAEAHGLETRVGTAGNHSAVLPANGPSLLLGAHLDSVRDGGRYDGALGVVAALHVLAALQEAELPLALEAIDFTDEEGTLVGLLDFRGLAGHAGTTPMDARRDAGLAAAVFALAANALVVRDHCRSYAERGA